MVNCFSFLLRHQSPPFFFCLHYFFVHIDFLDVVISLLFQDLGEWIFVFQGCGIFRIFQYDLVALLQFMFSIKQLAQSNLFHVIQCTARTWNYKICWWKPLSYQLRFKTMLKWPQGGLSSVRTLVWWLTGYFPLALRFLWSSIRSSFGSFRPASGMDGSTWPKRSALNNHVETWRKRAERNSRTRYFYGIQYCWGRGLVWVDFDGWIDRLIGGWIDRWMIDTGRYGWTHASVCFLIYLFVDNIHHFSIHTYMNTAYSYN